MQIPATVKVLFRTSACFSARSVVMMARAAAVSPSALRARRGAAYLAGAARLCRQHGVHLILDEVATGFGRTGTMFACEQAGVEPDFLCLSKGLTGGFLPLAATLTSEEIPAAFYGDYRENRTFYHGHTFTGNPLGCAAALGSLQVFAEEDTLTQLPGKIARLRAGLARFRELPWVGDLRQLGMIAALELVKDRESRVPFAFADRVGWRLYLAGLEVGLLLRPLEPTVPAALDDLLLRMLDKDPLKRPTALEVANLLGRSRRLRQGTRSPAPRSGRLPRCPLLSVATPSSRH